MLLRLSLLSATTTRSLYEFSFVRVLVDHLSLAHHFTFLDPYFLSSTLQWLVSDFKGNFQLLTFCHQKFKTILAIIICSIQKIFQWFFIVSCSCFTDVFLLSPKIIFVFKIFFYYLHFCFFCVFSLLLNCLSHESLSLHVPGVPCLSIDIQEPGTKCWLEPLCLGWGHLWTERWGMEPILLRRVHVSICRSLRGRVVFSEEASTFLPDGDEPGNASSGGWLRTLPAGSRLFSVVLYLQLEVSWVDLLFWVVGTFFDSLHILIFSQQICITFILEFKCTENVNWKTLFSAPS